MARKAAGEPARTTWPGCGACGPPPSAARMCLMPASVRTGRPARYPAPIGLWIAHKVIHKPGGAA